MKERMRDKNGCKESTRQTVPAAWQKVAVSGEIFIVYGFIYTLGFFEVSEILLGYFHDFMCLRKT